MDFMVFGMGRSGTKWLAETLDNPPDAKVRHEWVPGWLPKARDAMGDPDLIKEVWPELKKHHLELYEPDVRIRGEVNSLNWAWIPQFRELYPNASFTYLVRDGHKVVRSIMTRVYSGRKFIEKSIPAPPPYEEISSRWLETGVFERACWFWSFINRKVGNHFDDFVRLEDLTTDWDLFQKTYVDPFNLQIDRASWFLMAQSPSNTNRKKLVDGHESWDQDKHDIFDHHCGELMEKFGYS